MVKNTAAVANSGTRRSEMPYSIAIGVNLLFALGHMVYAFMEYDAVKEAALWFVSGGLATFFNACLNFLCLREGTKLSHATAKLSNLLLLIFSIVLAIVVTEVQTICFAFVVLFTFVVAFRFENQQHEDAK